jgi:hypothetical protein
MGMHPVTVDAGKLNVFISYSRDDLAFADQLDEALEPCGFANTLDRQGIAGGEGWRRRLGNLIREVLVPLRILLSRTAIF